MTRVKYEQRDDIYKLTISGHANYSKDGADIVCSGISAIAFGLMGFLENHRGHAVEGCRKKKAGYFEFFYVGDEIIKTGFEFAVIALMQIEKTYPDYVKVDVKGKAFV